MRRAALISIVVLAAVAIPGSALATSSPPTITSTFTPALVAVGGTSSLAVTLTNPNATGSLSAISFTDTLPAGLVVDGQTGQSGTCGSAGTLSANPGASTISLTSGKLAAGASCTVSADVTANAPGIFRNSTGPASSLEGGSALGSGDTESLTVVAAPTITLRNPAAHDVFNFAQKVKASYSCQEAANGPGIIDCSGDAASGALIDTSVAGAQTFTVSASSADGQVTTETVDYTVRPDNHFALSKIKPSSNGSVGFAIVLPGPGTASILESARSGGRWFTFAKLSLRAGHAVRKRVVLKPDVRGARLVTALSAARKSQSSANAKPLLSLRLVVVFRPKGGRARRETVHGIRIP